MSVEVRPVGTRRELREFIELPFRLHSNAPQWCPPLLIERRFKGRIRPGGLFALYVLVYSIGRLWIETLRIDPSHEIGGIRLNVFVAAAAIVLSAAFFVVWQRRWKRGGAKPTKVKMMAVPKGR